jgi:DNA-binding HxlR family transcriptional regulator
VGATLKYVESADDDPCPIHCCSEILCSKWTVLVVRDLLDGPKYFRDLELSLAGISPRTLCDRLKFLAERGIISRTYIKALPPRSEYALTVLGQELAPIVEQMAAYGRKLRVHSQQVTVAQ